MFTISKRLPCRRDVRELTTTERIAFTVAVKSLKTAGGYDPYVLTHQDAMSHGTPSGTPSSTRNAAHRGPAFLPWHREFLLRLESDLRDLDPTVALPYWNWAVDAALPDPEAAEV